MMKAKVCYLNKAHINLIHFFLLLKVKDDMEELRLIQITEF